MTALLERIRADLSALIAEVDAELAKAPTPIVAAPPPASGLAWGAKVSPAFRARVRLTGQDFGFDPDWLMACMAFETMETFAPDIRPRRKDGTLVSSAVGLIQFLEAVAKGLGTSTAALAAMTAEKQFDYVWLYLRDRIREHGQIRTLEDVYMAIHWPVAMGKPNETTLYVDGSSAYAANAGLDLNHDHVITKAEAGKLVRAKLELGLKPEKRRMTFATILAWALKHWQAIGLAALIALIPLAYWKGRGDEAALVKQRAAAAEARQDARKATADGHADLARSNDAAKTANHEKDLTHADDAQDDAAPSRARLALNCERLRQQGSDPAKVPACRGLGGGSQARPQH